MCWGILGRICKVLAQISEQLAPPGFLSKLCGRGAHLPELKTRGGMRAIKKAGIYTRFAADDGNRTRDLRTTNATHYRLCYISLWLSPTYKLYYRKRVVSIRKIAF